MLSSVKFGDFNEVHNEQSNENKLNKHLEEIETVGATEDDFYKEQFILFQDIIIALGQRLGDGEALEIKGIAKKMSKLLIELSEDLHDELSMICEQYSPKNTPFNYGGYEFHRSNGRKMYEWKTLPDIDFHLQQIDKVKLSYKQAEMAHRFGDKAEYINPENGDVFQPIPVKYSKDIIKVKEVKQ
jgi:hypothetical protein